MNISFENQVTLVTGAASGLGLATAKAFAASGASVVLADYNEQAVRAAADALAAEDLQASLRVSAHLQGRVAVENVFDARYQTGRNVGGVVTIGAPRLVNVGLRLSY